MSQRPSSTAPVVIVGAGPVGLALALGLSRQGVRSVLVEQNASTGRTSRAPGLHVRTREIFRQWGIEEQCVHAGQLLRELTLHRAAGGRPLLSVDFSELEAEADRPGLLLLEQDRTEQVLLEALQASGRCEVCFRTEAISLEEEGGAVRVTVCQDGIERDIRAQYLVGCDGAGSTVRKALGLPFDGITYALRPMLADVRVRDARDALPSPRAWNGPHAFAFAVRLPAGLWRIVSIDGEERAGGDDVSPDEVHDRVAELLGPGGVDIVWASRFRIHMRSSPRFRVGRVLLAGDAAHVHSPISGLGMNGGIQDAHNLAWKLAAALRGGDVDRLLDSYDVERRAVIVGQVSRYTDALTRAFLRAPRSWRFVAFALARLVFAVPAGRRRGLRRTAMIDLDYPESPLLRARDRAAGVRVPNPELRDPGGRPVRLYDLLPNDAVVIDVSDTRAARADIAVGRVIRIGPGGYSDPSGRLQEILDGQDGWILVRPDAHVAWARTTLEHVETAVAFALGG